MNIAKLALNFNWCFSAYVLPASSFSQAPLASLTSAYEHDKDPAEILELARC